jgi:hypothetical protein
VNVNYRLGIFGFPTHPELTIEPGLQETMACSISRGAPVGSAQHRFRWRSPKRESRKLEFNCNSYLIDQAFEYL